LELRVVGCHGGETPKHRTSAFVLDDRVALDAGSLTSGLDLAQQSALEAVLVSHAHLDHIRDLATIADNRNQQAAAPLVVAGTRQTIAILKKHFFNNLLWPDFSKIPTRRRPAIRYMLLQPEKPAVVAGYRVCPVPVSHTIDCCAFLVSGLDCTLAYSGDTGPTDRLWEVLSNTENLKALLMEVSFPNSEGRLARRSGHHTPETMARDVAKLEKPAPANKDDRVGRSVHEPRNIVGYKAKELPTLLYHIKPCFQAVVERECARLAGLNLTVCALGDQYIL
jgi:3',5'-cyclic-nucleotide phosphodiesterase